MFLEEKSHGETKERLDAVYGDFSRSKAAIKNWFNELQRNRSSNVDEQCSYTPKTAITEDNLRKVNNFVLEEQPLKAREIAEGILYEILSMRKLRASWAPTLQTSKF